MMGREVRPCELFIDVGREVRPGRRVAVNLGVGAVSPVTLVLGEAGSGAGVFAERLGERVSKTGVETIWLEDRAASGVSEQLAILAALRAQQADRVRRLPLTVVIATTHVLSPEPKLVAVVWRARWLGVRLIVAAAALGEREMVRAFQASGVFAFRTRDPVTAAGARALLGDHAWADYERWLASAPDDTCLTASHRSMPLELSVAHGRPPGSGESAFVVA